MWQDFWMEMGLSVHELSNDPITGYNLRFVLALASSKRQLVIDFWFNSRINFSMEVCEKTGWYVWIYNLWERFSQTLLRRITTLCQNQTTTSEALFTNYESFIPQTTRTPRFLKSLSTRRRSSSLQWFQATQSNFRDSSVLICGIRYDRKERFLVYQVSECVELCVPVETHT